MTYCDNKEHLFILGSARSGTSLMASIVQSSPEFASYRAETKLLNSCRSKYGNLTNVSSRKKFLNDWFRSRQFSRTGLTETEVRQATKGQQSYIGFLGTYMNMVAEKQGRQCWIDSTPSNANCLKQISTTFPNAKVLHMVRDGRAVSLSLAKLGWTGVRTSNFNTALTFSALKWQSVVEKLDESKKYLPGRFLEVKYEDLVQNPVVVLSVVSDFLQIPTFDDRLLEGGFVEDSESINSTLRSPNSLFGDMTPGISTNAAFRWKTTLNDNQISLIEADIGASLTKYGYPLVGNVERPLYSGLIRACRKTALRTKGAIKQHTILGRFSASPLEIGYN